MILSNNLPFPPCAALSCMKPLNGAQPVPNVEDAMKHSILRTKLKMLTIRTILFLLLVLTFSIQPRGFYSLFKGFAGASF